MPSACCSLEHNACIPRSRRGAIHHQIHWPPRLRQGEIKTVCCLQGRRKQAIINKYALNKLQLRHLTLREIKPLMRNSVVMCNYMQHLIWVILSTWGRLIRWGKGIAYYALVFEESSALSLRKGLVSAGTYQSNGLGWHFEIDCPGQVLRDLVHWTDIFQMSDLVQSICGNKTVEALKAEPVDFS